MSQIDSTYFDNGLIVVPNLDRPEIKSVLDYYIDFKEDEYLDNALGYQLKTEYLTGLQDEPILDKWTKLRDGAEFTYNNVLYKWKGFVNAAKDSTIAYYVYFYYVRENNIRLESTGMIMSENENSTRVSPLLKLVDVWNLMVKHNRTLELFIKANEADYINYNPEDCMTKMINQYGF